MRLQTRLILAGMILCLAASVSWAGLSPYSQDFEGLTPAPQELPATSLGGDGWLFFGNVFGLDWNYWYGYGPNPSPNHGGAVSAVVTDQGGPDQGFQQLSVFSDYGNFNHPWAWIETNVFQERTIDAMDVGSTWRFTFDAKKGNIEFDTTAKGFIKTLDPASNYALTNFITEEMTFIQEIWGTYSIDIYIDPSLEGQILQFGFLNLATGYKGSGIFYDNVNFDFAPIAVALDIRPEGCPNPITGASQGLLPAAVLGTMDFDVSMIDTTTLALEGVAPVQSHLEDVATPFAGDLCGCTTAGPDGYVDMTLKFKTQEILQALGSPHSGGHVLTLTGALLDGTPIEGMDCVVIVGGGKRPDVNSTAGGANDFGSPWNPTSFSEKAGSPDSEEQETGPRERYHKPRYLRTRSRAN